MIGNGGGITSHLNIVVRWPGGRRGFVHASAMPCIRLARRPSARAAILCKFKPLYHNTRLSNYRSLDISKRVRRELLVICIIMRICLWFMLAGQWDAGLCIAIYRKCLERFWDSRLWSVDVECGFTVLMVARMDFN